MITSPHARICPETTNRLMKKLFLPAVFLLLAVAGAHAQTVSCAQTLRLARSTYEQGRLHEIPAILESCIQTGFNDQEKVDAYKLLTLTYIYLEEPDKADENMLSLLKTDPYFEINSDVDPAEFVALYKTFRTRPIYRLGVKLGTNLTSPYVVSYNSIGEGNSSYTKKFAFNGGVTADIPITDKLTINPELDFVIKSFDASFDYLQEGEVYATTTGGETQRWISLPVVAQYNLYEKRDNPNVEPKVMVFGSAGIVTDYLLASTISAEQKREGSQSIEFRSFDAKDQRQKVNISASLGAGVKLKLAGGYFVGEARYCYGFSKINSSSTLLSNQNLLFDYTYSDGIYRLNSLFITVGYVQNFFNPKKKKIRE